MASRTRSSPRIGSMVPSAMDGWEEALRARTGVGGVEMAMPATRQEAQEAPEARDGHKDGGPNVHVAPGGSQTAGCLFCGKPLGKSRHGGKPRRFCSPDHRIAFHAEGRRVGEGILLRRLRMSERGRKMRVGPRRASTSELKKVGVTMSESQIWLTSDSCGERWQPQIQPGGRMPRDYWRCPKGCNS